MTSNIQDTGRAASAVSTKKAGRPICAGIAAALLLSCSAGALRADTSNAELAKEIAELKAQIRELRGSVSATRVETRREVQKVKAVASRAPVLPPPSMAYPAGAVPAFVTADKKLVFGGVTITPGGFIAAESVFRSRTTQSDINSAFGNIPFSNSPLAHTNEYRLTARQSRAALLVEGAITPSLIASAYGEFDFLGAGTTSNATDTNSYAPRIRNLYATLDSSEYGMHVLAGQNWSLLTLNSKGITPRNEVPPPGIDGQFLPGFTFARQAQIRLVKDFGKKLWIGLSAEEAQTTFGAAAACTGSTLTGAGGAAVTTPVGTTVNAVCAATGSGAGFSQYGQPYSLNHVPDVIGKVAYEATLGDRDIHIEGEGVYKNLYDRSEGAGPLTVNGVTTQNINTLGTGVTHNATGYGFGAGIIVPVIPKRLDFQGSFLAGRGIGRYGAGLLPDATINAQGGLRAIGEVQGLAGFTLHATPAIDFYVFAGIEKEQRTITNAPNGAQVGYGVTTANNSGCFVENGVCAGATKQLFQVTGGMWDKVYKGSFGEVRAGLQYSYTQRDLFSGTGASAANALYNGSPAIPAYNGQPKTGESTVFTSLRYYPFQ